MSGGLRKSLTAAFQLEKRPSITSVPLFLAPSYTPIERLRTFPPSKRLESSGTVEEPIAFVNESDFANPARIPPRRPLNLGKQPTRAKSPAVSKDATETRELEILAPKKSDRPTLGSSQQKSSKQAPTLNDLLDRLDRFLPLEFRSKTWLENLASFEGVKDIRHLPDLQVEFREVYKHGLLTYIALEQGRWPAAIFLSKALLTLPSTGRDADFFEALFSKESPWSMQNTPVLKKPDENTDSYKPHAIVRDRLATSIDQDVSFSRRPKIDLHQDRRKDSLTMIDLNDMIHNSHDQSNTFDASFHSRGWLAELWYFLGQVVLRSMQMDRDVAKRTLVHVADIVAEMHHTDHISPRLYSFDGSNISGVLRKPPTLHLLESKILTTLSDAMWRSKELDTLDYSMFQDPEIAAQAKIILGVQPSVPKLRPELWMELILWSCLYGGFYSQAISLLREMLFSSENTWRISGWHSFENSNGLHPYGPGGTSFSFGPRTPERLKRMAGTTEGYGVGNEMVSIPSRHISSEVVSAIVLGAAQGVPLDELHDVVQNFIVKAQPSILGSATPEQNEDMITFWYDVVTNIKDRAVILGDIQPQFQDQLADIVDLPPIEKPKTQLSMVANYPVQGERMISLSSFVSLGSLDAAKSVLKALFETVERFRYNSISTWWRRVLSGDQTHIYSQPPDQQDDDLVILDNADESMDEGAVLAAISADSTDPNMHVNMPLPTLVKLYELADLLGEKELKGLLFQDDSYQTIMPYPEHRVSSRHRAIQFQQKFNALEQDTKVELIEMLLTRDDIGKAVPKQFLSLASNFYRPDLAEQFLFRLRQQRTGIIVWPIDIMNMAKTYLTLPTKTTGQVATQVATLRLLDKMLSSDYDPPYRADGVRDFRAQQMRNQCRRIISTIPNRHLKQICAGKVKDHGRRNAPTRISAEAFNTLLATVVDIYGAEEGRYFCEMYCKFPTASTLAPTPAEIIGELASQPTFLRHVGSRIRSSSHIVLDPTHSVEQVVEPNLSTVQIVMRNAVKKATESSEKLPLDLSRWIIDSYRRLGMSSAWIAEQLPSKLLHSSAKTDPKARDDELQALRLRNAHLMKKLDRQPTEKEKDMVLMELELLDRKWASVRAEREEASAFEDAGDEGA